MMRDLLNKTKLIAILAITLVLVVIGVLNLRDRLNARPIPHDGIEWIETDEGIQAKAVSPESPLYRVVEPGDYLRFVQYQGMYEEVNNIATLMLYLERQGIGNDALYAIEHQDPLIQSMLGMEEPLFDAPFKTISLRRNLSRELYLAFIGLVYLAIGLFVLFKQSRAHLTYHFFAWSLISFVVYFYASTNSFNRIDKLASVLDASCLALLAPLFLHFCANFPSGKGLSLRARPVVASIYAPTLLLIAAEVFWHYKPSIYGSVSLVQARNWLDTIELAQYGIFFLAGSALLVRTFVRSRNTLLRQQLKWIVWGLGLSILPFAVGYIIPYISNIIPYIPDITVAPLIETLSYVPLILIPLSFGYSIVRYRLMDVDVIMRRSFVHVMAIIAVAALYMAMLLGVSDLIKFIWESADLNSWNTRIIVIIGMLIVTVLFTPIKNRLQVWADRWFYGERYTMRAGLQDFGRTLSQTTALPQLLDSLVRRLSNMLSVDKVAIFIEDKRSPSGFRLTHAMGIESEIHLPENIRNIIRSRSIGRGFISALDLDAKYPGKEANTDAYPLSHADDEKDASPFDVPPSDGKLLAQGELYYYVPCVVRDRMVAIIGVGRETSGAFLTSEDTDLLRALSGYVAVAIDNSLLYRSELEKAEEMALLKEFSESIIESVNVGILVIDSNGRITTWNSALEEILGITRERAIDRNIDEVFDRDLIETIQYVIGQDGWAISETHHIYKYNASTEDGRPLTLNISLAPFEAARGVVTGTLVVFENVTERVQLEQQLLEREKLSSIGLLAAGVAHEVNTPLTGISSYAQMLLQQVSESDPKYTLLEKIRHQTLRASGIVNNLLNFSRTGDTKFQETNLNSVLEDTLQLLEPQIHNTRIEIVRHYGEDLPAAYGSPSKLQQVFMNMILNARDAMPSGGRLMIHTRLVDTSLVVDFRDTGTGIAPENIARIYDPFFTTKEVGQGTGLGLALSYGIIQEHGGRIFVESRLGEGANFTIKLPTAISRQMQAASD
ncbi:MAG: PAS domain S-box protein [Blastocatellia bacterium]|nr:PAS domain S-box protein [Blastocatellia bacterium]